MGIEPTIYPGQTVPKRVLLIDDEPYIREVVTHCLGRVGHRVMAPEVADPASAESARHLALAGAYDVLLIDLRLPHIDPIEILDKLIITGAPTQPIALAAFLPDPIRDSLRTHGCHRFVEKPFSFTELRAEVDDCLRVVA